MNYKALFDQSPDAMLRVEDNAIVDCNAASICLFGYTSRSELLSISISVISPEYQSDGQSSTVKFSHIISHAFEQGSISFDWTYINANGHPFFTRVSLVSVTEGSKKLLHFIINDISRVKEDENAILDTNKKLVEAQRIAKMGSWALDLVKNKLSWSEEIFNLFEINSAQFDASYQAFIDAIHPDDREMVDKAYTDSLKSRKPYQITHRLLFSDGRIKYVREACESSFDINGKPLNSQGTVQDITEQVEADNKVSLYASVFKHSPDAILITNPQNKIIAINPALIQLTGYSEDELLGQNPSILACDRTSHEVYEEMWRSIKERDHWRGELFDKRKDGAIYPKWLSISTIRDSSNEIINYVATFF